MEDFKIINLKELSTEQKAVVKHLNNMIIEYQQVFLEQPTELVVSKHDFNVLSSNQEYKYMLLGSIKIYKV